MDATAQRPDATHGAGGPRWQLILAMQVAAGRRAIAALGRAMQDRDITELVRAARLAGEAWAWGVRHYTRGGDQ